MKSSSTQSSRTNRHEHKRSCVRVPKDIYVYLVSISIDKQEEITRHVYECIMACIIGRFDEGALFTPYVCSTHTSYPHRDCKIVCHQFEQLGFLQLRYGQGEPIYSLRPSVLVHTPLSTLARAQTIRDKNALEAFIVSNSNLCISKDNTKK